MSKKGGKEADNGEKKKRSRGKDVKEMGRSWGRRLSKMKKWEEAVGRMCRTVGRRMATVKR